MLLRTTALLAVSLLAGIVAGCAGGTRTDRFDVSVRNNTAAPLTLSLAKDGPPYEAAWATPEDLAIESPRRREDWKNTPGGMSLLPPGKTATLQNLAGRFEAGARGYLRAYAGELTISEMLARTRDSPDRVDVPLTPGANDITIVSEGTRLKAERK